MCVEDVHACSEPPRGLFETNLETSGSFIVPHGERM